MADIKKIKVGGTTYNIRDDTKLPKVTYEWNKEFAAGSNGAISLGRYNIYDSQLTFDITSTTNQSLSGKLVIATQNGTIHQAKVFGDATGALVSKLIIYQSAISNSRSWVEVFCNFNGWSKNKVHVYAVALNSATVQKQMTSVTISNGVPAAANVTSGDTKWTGTIVNDFSHSHGISIKASSGTNKLTLAHGTKYELTAGGQSFIFTTPSDNNTHNSHAIISGTKSDNSTQIKGSASSGNITLGDSGVTAGAYGDTAAQTPGYGKTFKVPSISVNAKGIVTAIGEHTVKIPASDNSDTHYTNYLQIKGNDTEAVKFTQNADKTLNLKPGNNVSISAASGEITISATDTWRGIQNNLTSDSTTDSLSAKQGKELKKLVDSKSDSSHTHNYAGSSSAGGPANSVKNALTFGSKTYNGSSAQTITKDDVGLGNVDNTADKDKSVKYAYGAENMVSEDKKRFISYNNLLGLMNHAKVYYVDTSKTSTSQVYYNSQLASDKETISITMSRHSESTGGALKGAGIYDDNVGLVNVMQLKMGDIIITNNYPPRYISKKVQSSQSSLDWNVEFTILKNITDGMLKITGSSGFGDADWHYRKIGHFIFDSSDVRNGAPVHISGVIGSWAQEKMIFDIFVSNRGGLKVNGFVHGTNPSCRLVIDNSIYPTIFLAVKGYATYNITVDTFENAQNENNAVRGSFHIDWTGGDDFSGSDVGITAKPSGYEDLLSRVASQRAYYSYTGTFAETNGTATKLCDMSGGDTGKIICVHGIATSTNSELSIQRRNSNYYDYDCIAIAPTGYSTGTYISCTGVVPPRLQYSINTDSSVESTYYIFGKNISNVYVITFDLP